MKLSNQNPVFVLVAILLGSATAYGQINTGCVDTPVYVQAGRGSFNHQAISVLQKRDVSLACTKLIFAGTPADAMEKASASSNQGALAFVAADNSIVGLIKPTIEALQNFKPVKVVASIKTPIEMCLLVLRNVGKVDSISQVASIRPALDQVQQWISVNRMNTIEEPKGTSYAAEILSQKRYPKRTGVIGSRELVRIYPQLKPLVCGIEDRPSITEFMLIQTKPRVKPISQAAARKELQGLLVKAHQQE